MSQFFLKTIFFYHKSVCCQVVGTKTSIETGNEAKHTQKEESQFANRPMAIVQ